MTASLSPGVQAVGSVVDGNEFVLAGGNKGKVAGISFDKILYHEILEKNSINFPSVASSPQNVD